jgi:CheY-like chemotaxis protein
MAMVSPRARKKELRLHGEVRELLTTRRGDPLRLRQILVNLLYNAVKYTPRGQVAVTVAAGRGDAVVFTITDTGVGIAEEQQAAVFEPFVQAHRDDAAEGVGLGLAITRELVSLLGGTIGLRSELGAGTEVTVTLELPPGSGSGTDRLRAIDPMSTPAIALLPANSRALRVLVAEDHATNAAIAQAILERAGHCTLWVTTGAAAVAAVAAERFDAVLMDLEMPELDGAEATRRIRQAEQAAGALRLPIIALSAHKHGELTAAGAGMDAFLAKPLDPIALGELLERVIAGQLRPPIDHAARLGRSAAAQSWRGHDHRDLPGAPADPGRRDRRGAGRRRRRRAAPRGARPARGAADGRRRRGRRGRRSARAGPPRRGPAAAAAPGGRAGPRRRRADPRALTPPALARAAVPAFNRGRG